MFKLVQPLPEKVLLACSGGVDSMVALHWLHRGKKLAGILHMNHGTGTFANRAEDLVYEQCHKLDLPIRTRTLVDNPPVGESKEAWWRGQRYSFFNEASEQQNNIEVVTAHNLNDCVEEYVINTMVRGRLGVISYRNGPVIRPFRTWSRPDIVRYAMKHDISYLTDPSNSDTRYLRNGIRHEVLPMITRMINPGLEGMIRRMIENEGLD